MSSPLVNYPEMATEHDARQESAEILALDALGFLAAEPQRLARYLSLTGLSAADLMARAAEPSLLGAVLDHLLADETLLCQFAADAALDPSAVRNARRRLPGGADSA